MAFRALNFLWQNQLPLMVFPENKLHINNNYGCIVIIITNETISTEACDTKKIMKRKSQKTFKLERYNLTKL
jgi:hypothetical protein